MGIDDIPEYIIKNRYPKITTALAYLSLSTGYFPDQLKIARIRNGCCELCASFINLFFSKIMEKIMHKRLLSFLNNHSMVFAKRKQQRPQLQNL
jgi:hypothetical protein